VERDWIIKSLKMSEKMKNTLPTWNPETFFTKVSKGSFAAKAARIDVYKNNCEIFKAGGYVSLNDKDISR